MIICDSEFVFSSEGTGSPESLLKAFDGAKAPGSNSKAYEKIGFRPSTYFKGWHTNAGYPVLTVNKIDESLYEISQVSTECVD